MILAFWARLVKWLTTEPAPAEPFNPDADETIQDWRAERDASKRNTLRLTRNLAGVPAPGLTGNIFEDELFGPAAKRPRG